MIGLVVPDGEVPAPGRLREALTGTAERIEREVALLPRRVNAQRTPLLTRQHGRATDKWLRCGKLCGRCPYPGTLQRPTLLRSVRLECDRWPDHVVHAWEVNHVSQRKRKLGRTGLWLVMTEPVETA